MSDSFGMLTQIICHSLAQWNAERVERAVSRISLGVVVAYQFMFEYKLHFSVFTLYSEHAEIGGTMLEKVGGTLNVIP